MKNLIEAKKLGKELFYRRSENRKNNTFLKCRQAVGERRAKSGKFYAPPNAVFYRWAEWEKALHILKLLTKKKKINAFDFVVIHEFVSYYMGLQYGAEKRYNEIISAFNNVDDLDNHDVVWGLVFYGEFEESWCCVTSTKLWKSKVKKQKEHRIKKALENSIKDRAWIYEFPQYSDCGKFTKVRYCKLCNKVGSTKNIHDRCFYMGVHKPKKTYKLKEFFGHCCVSCWNKYKPVEKMAVLANELRLKTNRALKQRKEILK
jgi:hypothetical protein